MCGGGGGGGVSERLAVQSANQEQARQDRINEGMRQLEVMFNGGRNPTGQVGAGARYNPNQAYYDKNGNAWSPGDVGAYRNAHTVMTAAPYNRGGGEGGEWVPAEYGPDPGSDDEIRQRMFEEAIGGGGIYTGAEDVAGYQPEFYDKAYQAQLDYALPQVDRQYADAQKNLQFALARQGLSASSQAGRLQADLARERDLAIQGVQDQASTVRQKQMAAVEDERSNLTQMLQQTGDVQSTMNAAAARKGIIESAPALEAVGPLFQNATGSLADMIVSPALRQANQNSSSSGYGTKKGSGKVVS